jgi:hypothetical protein
VKKLLFLLLLLLLLPGLARAGGACPTGVNYLNPASEALVTLSSLGITSCYYISSAGADSNSGTSESSTWAHAPGMPNCSSNCATVYNGGNVAGGLGFIFRGGDTWHFGNNAASPYTGGTWSHWIGGTSANCVYGGTMTGCLYFGVDQSWYSGGAWSRPILTGDNPLSTSRVASCPYRISSGNQMIVMGPAAIMDNFELVGLCSSDVNPGLAFDTYLVMNAQQPTYWLLNLYIHGWTVTTTAGGGGTLACVAIGGGAGDLAVIDYTVVDGADSKPSVCAWGTFPSMFHMKHNIFRYVTQGVGQDCHDIHDNIFEYFDNPDVPTHGNIMECNYDYTNGGGIYPVTANVFYNNVVRHATTAFSQNGQVVLWFCPTSVPEYWFNNLVYDVGNSNYWDVAGPPIYSCSNTGGQRMFNNTLVDGTQPCKNSNTTTGGQYVFVYNEHLINTPFGGGAGTDCNGHADVSNIAMTDAVSTTQGYTGSGVRVNTQNASTTCANEITPCAPTISTNGTIGKGINEQPYCAVLGTYTAEYAISTEARNACLKGTTDACTYNTTKHTMQCPAQPAQTRSSAQWNSGAYEFGGGGAGSPTVSLSPSPVTFGNVNIGSSLTFPGPNLTNAGNANLVLNNPYFSVTGTNAADFAVVGGGTCSNGGTVTPGNSCSIATKFTPTVNGSETATLNISGNAVGSVSMTGSGVASVGAVTITPGATTGSFVQTCLNALNNAASSITCTFANPQTLNNTNICYVGWYATTGSVSSITDTAGNSYGSSILTTTQSPLGAGTQAIYVTGGIKAQSSNIITVNLSASLQYPELKCEEILGTTPVDAAGPVANQSTAGTAMTSGNVTVSFAPIMMVASTLDCASPTSPGTGWTQRGPITGGDIIEDQYSLTSGTFAATATQSGNVCYIMQMVPLDAPTLLDFGSQTDSTTSGAHVGTATNSGNVTLTLNNSPHYYTITGTNAADFAVVAGASNCTDAGSLTAGSSCTMNVTFTPAAMGTRTAALNWGSNGASGTLNLTGIGVASPQCATPGFNPVSSTVTSGTVVNFTGGCASGTFCSTVDGSAPTGANNGTCTHGTSGGSVTVNVSEQVQVISVKAANNDSLINVAAYTVNGTTLATPTFSPTVPYSGAAVLVNISFPGVSTGCITLDGSTPTGANGACGPGSSFNTGTIQINNTATLSAIATQSGFTNSAVASGVYTIITQVGLPVFATVTGKPGFPQSISITSPIAGSTLCYTRNGRLPTTDGAGHCTYGGTLANGGTLAVNQTTLINVIGTESGLSDSPLAMALAVVSTSSPDATPQLVILLF